MAGSGSSIVEQLEEFESGLIWPSEQLEKVSVRAASGELVLASSLFGSPRAILMLGRNLL